MDDQLKAAIRKAVGQAVANANSIGDIWSLYEGATLVPLGASPVQRQECKRAFYSGAAAALELFVQIGEPGFEEDAGVERMRAIERELSQFGRDIAAGRA